MQTALDIAILRARCARHAPRAVMEAPKPPLRIIDIVECVESAQINIGVAKPKPWADYPSLRKAIRVIRAACNHFGIDRATLLLRRNKAEIAYPRHVAIYVASRVTKLSLHEIGRRMGGRDHTTILHGARKIERLLSDPRVAADCEDLARAIGEVF